MNQQKLLDEVNHFSIIPFSLYEKNNKSEAMINISIKGELG